MHVKYTTATGATPPLSDVRMLLVREVAEVLRVNRATVYRWINAGDLPALKKGGVVRVREDVVLSLLAQVA